MKYVHYLDAEENMFTDSKNIPIIGLEKSTNKAIVRDTFLFLEAGFLDEQSLLFGEISPMDIIYSICIQGLDVK